MFKNIKNRKRKYPKYFYLLAFGIFLLLGVGYSIVNSTLGIEGIVTASHNSWNIYFDNISYTQGSVTATTPATITGGTTLNFNVTLTNPGDKYEFSFDIKNTGTMDALIKTINKSSITDEQANYLRYVVEYEDGTDIEINDLLKSNATKKVHVLVEYKRLRATDLYPSTDVNLNMTIGINFYLPKTEYYTLTLNQSGNNTTYKVLNTEQQITLDDITLGATDKVIACNNGVVPTTDNNDKIVIKNVKSNATCRIESTLASAVTNSSNEKTNIAILANDTTTSNVTVAATQDITIDLNGKKHITTTNSDIPSLINRGYLVMYDSKENGEFTSNYRGINNYGTLIINSGIYKREGTTESGGVIVTEGGTTYLNNSTFISDKVWTIYIADNNSKLYINNCSIESNEKRAISIYSNANNGLIEIKNSVLTANNYHAITNQSNNKVSVYICNSKINATTVDIETILTENTKIYYSSNTIFSNNSNIPTLYNNNLINQVIKTDIACAE